MLTPAMFIPLLQIQTMRDQTVDLGGWLHRQTFGMYESQQYLKLR